MRFSIRKFSIRTKVTVSLLGILMILTVLTSVLFLMFRQKNLEVLYQTFSEILHVYSTRVEQELDDIETYSVDIISDPVLQDQLIRLNDTPKNLAYIEIAEVIDERIMHLTNRMGLEKVILIDINNRIASSRRDHPDVERFLAGGYPEHLININRNEEWILTSSQVSSIYYIRIIKKIQGLDLTPIGIILMEINKDHFWKSMRQSFPYQDLNLQIRSNNRTVFSTDPYYDLTAKDFEDSTDQYKIQTFNLEKIFFTIYNSPNRPLTYLLSIPYNSYFLDFQIYSIVVFSILGLLFLLVIPASILFARNITNLIIDLSQLMKQVESENFETYLSSLPAAEREDEIGLLYSEFHTMLNKIHILVNENLKKQILIKDTQYRNLQAQINPHFLYNTLESINWLARMNDQEEIAQMVQSLGALFRSSVGKQIIISIEEEIQLLRHYIRIQKTRFGERLDVIYEIDDSSLDCEVPKFLLQPLVENAIKYGVERVHRPCSLIISVQCVTKGFIEIAIRDNGPGMSEKRRLDVLQNTYKTSGTGIGIRNIMERIRQRYKDRQSFIIKSQEDEGTEIRIRFPQIPIEEAMETFEEETKL